MALPDITTESTGQTNVPVYCSALDFCPSCKSTIAELCHTNELVTYWDFPEHFCPVCSLFPPEREISCSEWKKQLSFQTYFAIINHDSSTSGETK